MSHIFLIFLIQPLPFVGWYMGESDKGIYYLMMIRLKKKKKNSVQLGIFTKNSFSIIYTKSSGLQFGRIKHKTRDLEYPK